MSPGSFCVKNTGPGIRWQILFGASGNRAGPRMPNGQRGAPVAGGVHEGRDDEERNEDLGGGPTTPATAPAAG